ncbi:uncharacterized protein VP01_370g5 [Puccinia sorghi]|uniref:Exonuclease domain-containing protein n=1 Tax=Puccinia sorghi TaxID=27349 RepID=A0A0L6UU34_9BASI|nr:uncharacterized protein VP01_370g5 [Puccinia sorghi]
MTGLDVAVDQIIEIACIITDKVTVQCSQAICRSSTTEFSSSFMWTSRSSIAWDPEVDQRIRQYLEHHLPGCEGKATLAGNSVYADKMFLDKDLPLVAKYLHYRLVDVSSIKELARRWEPELVELAKPASKPSKHRSCGSFNH